MDIAFKPSFLREFKKLDPALQDEAREKIILFKSPQNHAMLRVHKLKGRMVGRMSFSVNYRYRIVFQYADKTKREAILLAIGDHEVYQ